MCLYIYLNVIHGTNVSLNTSPLFLTRLPAAAGHLDRANTAIHSNSRLYDMAVVLVVVVVVMVMLW